MREEEIAQEERERLFVLPLITICINLILSLVLSSFSKGTDAIEAWGIVWTAFWALPIMYFGVKAYGERKLTAARRVMVISWLCVIPLLVLLAVHFMGK